MRELEGVTLDTPERRAGLEKRLREVASQIPDETLRRYYQQEIGARLSSLFARNAERSFSRRSDRDFGASRAQRSFGQRPEVRPGPVHVGSALANSALFRGVKPVMSAREGLILLILLNHPDLLAGQIDEIAALGELTGAEFDQAWATAMIAHHKGAIKMAETVKDDGQSTLVQDLANLIMQEQQSEIAVLETLLD
jgi:DNA primase